MKRMCFVHSGRKDIIDGVIEEVCDDTINACVYIDGDEYSVTLSKKAVIWNQQPYIRKGRYIAITKDKPNKIHLCTCVWTKKDLTEAEKRAAEISKILGGGRSEVTSCLIQPKSLTNLSHNAIMYIMTLQTKYFLNALVILSHNKESK